MDETTEVPEFDPNLPIEVRYADTWRPAQLGQYCGRKDLHGCYFTVDDEASLLHGWFYAYEIKNVAGDR